MRRTWNSPTTVRKVNSSTLAQGRRCCHWQPNVGSCFDSRRTAALRRTDKMGHVWTSPALQEKSDFSAKRSGAAMYSACFRLEACLHAMQPMWPLALM
jgi:hypothetical protein